MGESVEGGEEGMGLNLGLSIGGCFMGSSEEKDGVLRSAAAGEAGLLQQQRPSFRGMYCRNKEEAEEFLEQRRKKEMHALRRQAARRKRDEKRGLLAKAKKARSGEEGEDEQAGAADGKGKEEGEEEERRQQQGMYPGGGFPVVPMMQYVIQNGDKVQYIPVTVPCILPCWPASSPPPITGVGPVANGFCGADPVAIAARSGAGTLFQPVPCRSLPSEGGVPGGVNKLSGTQSSSGSSSSAVSDNKSGGGSTTDSVSQSQSSHNPLSEHCRPGSVSPVGRPEAVDMAEGNATVQWKPPAVPAAATVQPWKPTARAKAGTNNEGAVANGGETDRAQAEKAGTPAMPPSAGGGGGGGGAGEKVQKPSLNLPQMPCVSTTGNGPNGKTITGFLYRYTKSEVSIMCVCHGSSFSPAEFIKHAGGTDTDNPLRHIIVVPSPVG